MYLSIPKVYKLYTPGRFCFLEFLLLSFVSEVEKLGGKYEVVLTAIYIILNYGKHKLSLE